VRRHTPTVQRASVLCGAARAALVAAALLLPGCSSVIADLPQPIGLPAETPDRPATAPAYPAVHDMPPARSDEMLSKDEQARIEQELAAARDRQRATADKQNAGGKHNP
jgi:hypothetical protein